MKRLSLFLLGVLLFQTGYSDMVRPAGTFLTASKYEVKKGDLVVLTIRILPTGNRHIYSEKTTCAADVGSLEAELTFTGAGFELVGRAVGYGDKLVQDETAKSPPDNADCKIGVFTNDAVFKQVIRVTGTITDLVCAFYGQQCNDEGCVPINEKIKIDKPIKISENSTETKDPTATATEVDTAGTAAPPAVAPDTNNQNNPGGTHSYRAANPSEVGKITQLKYTGSLGNKETKSSKGLWLVFWLALSSGLLALLTPCVFPMIPMTVSFFIKNHDRKRAIRDGLIFALSIIFIYVVLGTIVSALFGPSAANWMSTHWVPNIFFFAIFIVFAASFFGAFEIVLPSSWVNAMDKRADKGGFTGPIFMAFTIALVSFSCTGPIVGTVLVESAKGGIAMPIVAMLGFSLAFALPFGLLVVFPSYLQSLPKSGGWLNSVKVVLGFVELAFAFKFLSTADQTYHWHILDREVYLSIWIVIAILLGMYLLGKIKFAHDSDLPYLSVNRLFMAIVALAFAVYMVPGLWGAPLKFLAGYLPPMATQDFDLNRDPNATTAAAGCFEPMYAADLHMPHNLKGYFDYEQALACSREQKKPLFIDFTGHGCVNCRKMEEKVWSDPEVLKMLKNDYIVVSLYVDDKKLMLPASDQFIARSDGHKVTKLGEKNTEIQADYFNSNSQPMYVLMNGDEVLLQSPGSAETFDYNPKKFAEFLKNGITEFRSQPKAK